MKATFILFLTAVIFTCVVTTEASPSSVVNSDNEAQNQESSVTNNDEEPKNEETSPQVKHLFSSII